MEKESFPPIKMRKRIVLDWINRRFAEHGIKHPQYAAKWLPLLEISLPMNCEALSRAVGREEWSLNLIDSVRTVAAVKPSAVYTWLTNYVHSLCERSKVARIRLIKDWDLARHILHGMEIDYDVEFLPSLDDRDRQSLLELYGQTGLAMADAGSFPPGMDSKTLQIRPKRRRSRKPY